MTLALRILQTRCSPTWEALVRSSHTLVIQASPVLQIQAGCWLMAEMPAMMIERIATLGNRECLKLPRRVIAWSLKASAWCARIR